MLGYGILERQLKWHRRREQEELMCLIGILEGDYRGKRQFLKRIHERYKFRFKNHHMSYTG